MCAPRLLVRALEIMQSCRILRQALTKMPSGEFNTGDGKIVFSTGTATSRVEAPRGEVVYSVSWKENFQKSRQGPCAYSHLSKYAGNTLDGDWGAARRYAADPGVH